jgi:acyl-coenzyme A synthetase/AMP-(fatty) acid ligase
MFDINLANFTNSICFIENNKTFTYKEVHNICNKITNNLPKQKKLVLILADQNLETIIGYLSFLRQGYACIMIDVATQDNFIQKLIKTYNPNYIWSNKTFHNNSQIDSFNSYKLYQLHSNQLHIHQDLALMLTTSGTTGSSKMVKLSKQNLYSNCNSIIEYLQVKSSDRVITTLPFHYSYGISVLNTHLNVGATIVITKESIISKAFWETFKKYNITTFNGVPYHYEILNKIKFFNMSLPSLKILTQAGGKLNEKLIVLFAKWAKENKMLFYVMYGQTEATARISYLPPQKTLIKLNSIGIPIPNGQLKIKDLNSNKFIESPHMQGELVYYGPNVMMGYAQTIGDLKLESTLDGVLYTGDIAYKDEEKYFYIVGRKKRFIKLYGHRINLDEIEQFLKTNNLQVYCTGDDTKLMIATEIEHNIIHIQHLITKEYKISKNDISIKYIKQIPITTSGKIQYKKLYEVLKNG